MADNQFQLAVVDPPYGILSKSGDRLDKYGGNRRKWDVKIPSNKYFIELTRISKNQIIWGGNYFPFLWKNGCKGFIFWYKHQPVSDWAAGELAWTSFNTPSRCFDYICYGGVNQDKNRIHPTQKPVALYKWILRNYAKEGNKILDTHLGSGSIAIACHDYGFDLTGYEIDKDYFEAAKKRLETHQMQQRINFEN
jgi:site-specific DNA-methyltransferase (adenine-specific)